MRSSYQQTPTLNCHHEEHETSAARRVELLSRTRMSCAERRSCASHAPVRRPASAQLRLHLKGADVAPVSSGSCESTLAHGQQFTLGIHTIRSGSLIDDDPCAQSLPWTSSGAHGGSKAQSDKGPRLALGTTQGPDPTKDRIRPRLALGTTQGNHSCQQRAPTAFMRLVWPRWARPRPRTGSARQIRAPHVPRHQAPKGRLGVARASGVD
jgi:hypothetical protein